MTKHGMGVLSSTPPLHWQLGARAEVSPPTLPATRWPPVRPLARSYSSPLSVFLWEQMDSVGLGCRPQTSSGTLEHVRGVSPSILHALQQGPLAPGFPASLPPLPPDANAFQGARVVAPALFSPPFSWGPHLVLSWSSTPLLFFSSPSSFWSSVCLHWSAGLAAHSAERGVSEPNPRLTMPASTSPIPVSWPIFFPVVQTQNYLFALLSCMLSLYPPSFYWLLILLSLQRPVLVPKLPLVNIFPPLTLESAFSLSSSPPSFQPPQPSPSTHTYFF